MRFYFNREQTKKFADTSSNLSILFFGVTLAPFVGSVDRVDYVVIVSSGILTLAFFTASLIVLKGIKDEYKS